MKSCSSSKPPTIAANSLNPVMLRHVKRARTLVYQRKLPQVALEFIEDSISCFPMWGHLRLVGAIIHKHLADYVVKDFEEKIKHLSAASCLARSATELLPNSLHCSSVLAGLLCQLAKFNGERDTLNQECLRGLKIENPIDPGIDRFYGDFVMKLTSRDSRIEDERELIRKILLSSMVPSDDLKKKSNELPSNVEPNDLKKNSNELPSNVESDDLKKPFEETKNSEIEKDIMEMEARYEEVEIEFVMWNRLQRGESKTSLRKFKGDVESATKFESVWRELSDEKKRGFMKVNVKELEMHLKSLRYHLAVDVLQEALDFAKINKTWKLWMCSGCSMKFGNAESYRVHFRESHWSDFDQPNLVLAMESLEVPSEWIEMIVKGKWKPVKTNLAINWLKSESKTSMGDQKLPLCYNRGRAETLKRIHDIYQLLHKNGWLERSYIDWAIRYTFSVFESEIPETQFKYHDMENPEVICLLGVLELKKILQFLKDLVHTIGSSKHSMMSSSVEDHESDMKEKIVFSRDYSRLLLDDRLLRGELNVTNYFTAIADDGSAVSTAADECTSDQLLPYGNDILSWLYRGLKINEDLQPWEAVREYENEAPKKLFRIFSDERVHFEKVCDRFSKISRKFDAVEAVYTLCLEEIKKRGKDPELYDLLFEQQIVLQGSEDIASRMQSDIISNLLKEIKAAESPVAMSGYQSEEGMRNIDNYITKALRELNLQLLKELAFLDAIVLRSLGAMYQYDLLLEKMSFYDFRSIMVPMLKSFLQRKLQLLLDKDTSEKSVALREACSCRACT